MPKSGVPFRLVFAGMGFFCFFNLYALRVDLSVALVSMINRTYMEELAADHNSNETKDASRIDGPFKWDSKQQGIILGSFFYGYIITQLPGGILSEKYGGKYVMLIGITLAAVLTLITPVVSEAGGFAGLVVLRILMGVGQGVAFPTMHVLLSQWAPPLERGRIGTFVYAGAQLGTVVTMPVSGVLCQKVSWQSVFYVFGAIAMCWSVMWVFLVYDKPSKHPWISTKEREYIESALATGPPMKKPWGKMATSPAVYALMAGNFAYNWGNFFLLTVTPEFLTYILKFSVQSSGIVAGAPYLAMWFGMLLSGSIADFLLSRKLLHITNVRKIFVVFGFCGPSACLIGTGYVNNETGAAVALLIITGFFIGTSYAGWGINHLDIAPPFAGTLLGITNCISTIPGFVVPEMVGALTYNNQTYKAWRSAFYISAGVLWFGTLVFVIIGTGERQKWSYPPESTEPRANEEEPPPPQTEPLTPENNEESNNETDTKKMEETSV